MNNIAIGKELKKLAFKRAKGQGEYCYVSAALGKEAQGKNEILELLKEDPESWESLDSLRLPGETEQSFKTKLKKQIGSVLFESDHQKLVSQTIANGSAEEKPSKKRKVPNKPAEDKENGHEVKDDDAVKCDEDIKPRNILTFVLAEVPKVDGTLMVDEGASEVETTKDQNDQIDAEDVIQTHNLMRLEDDKRCALVFHIKKEISHKDCKNFFLSQNENFKDVSKVQRTVTHDEKFRGVYLLTFSSEEAAREFVTLDIELNGIALETVLLLDYKREKYFKNQIIKARAFKANNDILLKHLQEEKKASKLENCAVIQVDATEEDVLEYYCGIESQFAEETDGAVDDVKTIESPKIPQYILVFNSPQAAYDFKKSPQYHKINDSEAKVSLMTDRMKLIRFGEKVKNFVDASNFSPSDNQRRIVVTSVKKDIPHDRIVTFFSTAFPKQIHIHRCQIDQFYFGVYVISFQSPEEASEALSVRLTETEVTVSPLTMLLSEYCLEREKYLKMKQIVKRKRPSSTNQKEDNWAEEFSKIERLHEEHWGKMETPVYNDNTGDDSDSMEDDNDYDPIRMLRTNIS